jgi:hypothetical protein
MKTVTSLVQPFDDPSRLSARVDLVTFFFYYHDLAYMESTGPS